VRGTDELTHLSLFTGIGGLDLAAEWAGFQTVGQCEFADYPTKVLEKHWPNVPRWRDVRELTAESVWERTGRKEITVISGGFPCQPHSVAGKRQASSDERDLWPEYRRVIGEVKPTWVVAENVRGLLSSEDGRFFRGILRDFADLGFNVGWCTYPAAWVGAVHRRERVFTIAHSNNDGLQGRGNEKAQGISIQLPETLSALLLPRYGQEDYISKPCICRTTDGVSSRTDRLKCLGNAVVPQQAYPIFKAIAEIEANIAVSPTASPTTITAR
jgi:DNA (cytosine-5)-methyltransferase 1